MRDRWTGFSGESGRSFRDKWDEDRGGMTYGEKTIETALGNAEKYWKSSTGRKDSAPVKAASKTEQVRSSS